MGRPRKTDKHLPPCVYLRHGAYYHVSKGIWTKLGRDLSAALAEYARRFSNPSSGMAALIDSAMNVISARTDISDNTKKQYKTAARKLKIAFQDFAPEQVTHKDITRLRRGMEDTPNMFNRCNSVLRQVFDYALEEELLDFNPAIGIRGLKEAKRDRLLTQQEFDAIYAVGSERLRCMMDIWYGCGQRVMDVVKIHLKDLDDEGIYFKQAKTGARLLVRWTPKLRDAVERAKAINGNVRSLSLFSARRGPTRGSAPAYATIRDEWKAACEVAGVENAQMRDLRAMSGTDADAQGKDATALLGHTSPSMTRRYLRSKKVPVVDGPSIGHLLDIGQDASKKQ